MYRDSGVLIGILPALGRHEIVIAVFSGVKVAALEDNRGVSENEVYGPIYISLSVELTLGESVEGVLVTDNGASEDHRSIRSDSKGNSLPLARTRIVHNGYVPSNESIAHHT